MFQSKLQFRVVFASVATIVALAAIVLALPAQEDRRTKATIEGTWTVESVEFAGQPVE